MIILFSCSIKEGHENESMFDLLHKFSKNANYSLYSTTICEQVNLSNQFDISIDFKRFSSTIKKNDSCLIKVILKDKISKSKLDSISIMSFFYFASIFSSCDSMTSYSTKFKVDRRIIDNYFGDIVVADLNFDEKDDIAIINNCGGNGGPLYSYYVQTKDRKFILDKFLTDSMVFFPSEINKENKTLTTYVHAGICWLGERVYKFDELTSWKEKSYRRIDICKEDE